MNNNIRFQLQTYHYNILSIFAQLVIYKLDLNLTTSFGFLPVSQQGECVDLLLKLCRQLSTPSQTRSRSRGSSRHADHLRHPPF